jgi:hypothetical protein
VQCIGDYDCGGPTPVCYNNQCVECSPDENACGAATPICFNNQCVQCTVAQPEACSGSTPVCVGTTCEECAQPSDCGPAADCYVPACNGGTCSWVIDSTPGNPYPMSDEAECCQWTSSYYCALDNSTYSFSPVACGLTDGCEEGMGCPQGVGPTYGVHGPYYVCNINANCQAIAGCGTSSTSTSTSTSASTSSTTF